MASVTTLSNAVALAMCNALTAKYDAGSGAAIMRGYTGTQPTNPDVAVGVQVLLFTLTYSDPAFAAAADANPGARATANAIASDTVADNTGTVTWTRDLDSDGLALVDGNAGTTDQAAVFNTDAIVAGATVAATSKTITVPET